MVAPQSCTGRSLPPPGQHGMVRHVDLLVVGCPPPPPVVVVVVVGVVVVVVVGVVAPVLVIVSNWIRKGDVASNSKLISCI